MYHKRTKKLDSRPIILLTGATGYVGGRLLKRLERTAVRVRCAARRPESLASRVSPGTEIVKVDFLDPASINSAMIGVQVAYYLVHSMGSSTGFEEDDRKAATNFAKAASLAGISRIIYLGGLGDSSIKLSKHLSSRQEVGNILRASDVPVLELRASIIIGSGSLSFELVRALVERLPVMITPRWVSVTTQPIAINDALEYLVQARTVQIVGNKIFEIGGPDVVTYKTIMREYAKQRGLRRALISVPFLTPRLSSLWLGLVTPVYARIGRKLIESIRHPTIVKDNAALREFNIHPLGIKEAVDSALKNEDQEFAETKWSDSISSAGKTKSWGATRFGTRFVASEIIQTKLTPGEAFKRIERIGGRTGWYYWNWLWRLRGFLDLLIGGVGMRRGRKNPDSLSVGDAVDFWRVEAFEAGRRVLFAAEMKLPGRAWLEFEVTGDGGPFIRQTAIFDPVGLTGQLYWYGLYPIHKVIFCGMLKRMMSPN
ncbi:MAG: SDR family oxidoreductase [Dehalococcoidia bacterium]|nr:SDR family oxidoreductase [Dehalococcoidia bacterium]